MRKMQTRAYFRVHHHRYPKPTPPSNIPNKKLILISEYFNVIFKITCLQRYIPSKIMDVSIRMQIPQLFPNELNKSKN